MKDSHETRCSHADDVAPFVIGALDHDAVDPFVEHLAGCVPCRAEVDQLRAMARMLPLASELHQPPPELKQRVMAVVRSEAELLRAAGPAADRVPGSQRRRGNRQRLSGRSLGAAFGALAVTAAVVLAIFAFDGGGTETRTVQARVAIPAAEARVELADGSGTLVASGMPSPSRGQVYAIWTQRGDERPRFVGTLGATGTAGAMRARLELDDVRQVMVTLEPARVGRSPTTEPIVTAELA